MSVFEIFQNWQEIRQLPTGLELYIQLAFLIGSLVFGLLFMYWLMKTREKK